MSLIISVIYLQKFPKDLFAEGATTVGSEVFQDPIYATQTIRNLRYLNNVCKL